MNRIGLISILLGLGIANTYSQDSIVTIPDTAFLHALIEEGVDKTGDSLISYSEAWKVNYLNISKYKDMGLLGIKCLGEIRNMMGIEAFINLTTLDVSGCSALQLLYCSDNQLADLNVSGLIALGGMLCRRNQLTTLDVSGLIALGYMDCSRNQLTTLEVSNTDLWTLDCYHNKLTSLDLSNNPSLYELNCSSNPLSCLDVSCCPRLGQSFQVGGAIYLGYFFLRDIPTNCKVCVCEMPFNPQGTRTVDTTGSPNVYFTTDCGGCDKFPPELFIIQSTYHPDSIKLSCTEDATIYLVPENTEPETDALIKYCIDSIQVSANTLYYIAKSGRDNGVYWLYARDFSGNISEPKAFTVTGVGMEQARGENFRIFPNPFSTVLAIELGFSDHYDVCLTSLNGQLIYSDETEGSTLNIDLSSFQKGVYLLTIRAKDFVTTRKIIKL
jgi:hypothetical protein